MITTVVKGQRVDASLIVFRQSTKCVGLSGLGPPDQFSFTTYGATSRANNRRGSQFFSIDTDCEGLVGEGGGKLTGLKL